MEAGKYWLTHTPSRGGRGRRAAVGFVVCSGCGGISCFFSFFFFGCKRPAANVWGLACYIAVGVFLLRLAVYSPSSSILFCQAPRNLTQSAIIHTISTTTTIVVYYKYINTTRFFSKTSQGILMHAFSRFGRFLNARRSYEYLVFGHIFAHTSQFVRLRQRNRRRTTNECPAFIYLHRRHLRALYLRNRINRG